MAAFNSYNVRITRKETMAIFQLFDRDTKHAFTETFDPSDIYQESSGKKPVFSMIITRFCFLLLFCVDLAWFALNSVFLVLSLFGLIITGGKSAFFDRRVKKTWLNFRRSAVCGLSLLVGLLSPPFGIMIACTYFLMYDKAGMEEVVPAPLQAQFKDIFHTDR
ncbi:MAG: hypothetical protein KR126chlam1_00089 [Chlamydiae bacterium]|nr:hypothetical protein [Chlamydiota bacterium]